jgi:hypothetical protein
MDYKMKKLGDKYPNHCVLADMYKTIMRYIQGGGDIFTTMSEKCRQYYTWGAHAFKYIVSDDGCYGIQFQVKGFLHRGRVRIYYNIGSDYFDVELLRARKDELVWGCEDLDFEQLHNVLHRHIERIDDPEV